MLTADILHMCSIRGMRRQSASGRPRRHVSFFDIGYEPTTLPTRPSNRLTSRQGRFEGRKSVPAARADRPLSGQLADLCQTAGADGDALLAVVKSANDRGTPPAPRDAASPACYRSTGRQDGTDPA